MVVVGLTIAGCEGLNQLMANSRGKRTSQPSSAIREPLGNVPLPPPMLTPRISEKVNWVKLVQVLLAAPLA